MKARFKGFSRDRETGHALLTFEILDTVIPQTIREMGEFLSLTVKKWSEKRSLDANAYYWVLITKLSEAIHVSKTRAHNLMLRRYGQMLFLDGQKVILMLPDTEAAEESALEAETFHVKPTSKIRPGTPVDYRGYIVLRGSSDYSTAEMSALLDGLISECKEVGIETATPEELKRMMEAYERNHSKR